MDTKNLKAKALLGNIDACKVILEEGTRTADETLIAAGLMGLHEAGEILLACQWLVSEQASKVSQLRNALLEEIRESPLVFANVHDLFGASAGWSLIPAGNFLMGGSQKGKRFVEISTPFLMKKNLVTQSEWQTLMGNNPSMYQGEIHGNTSEFPVERVSWYDSIAYCNRLSGRVKLKKCYDLSTAAGIPGEAINSNSETTSSHEGSFKVPGKLDFNFYCKGYRLPTEAEWEYACRAGSKTHLYGELDDIAWHHDNSDYSNHPVGTKAPNLWGLYDMIGHTWEWNWDAYERNPTFSRQDPKISFNNRHKYRISCVFRGVGWSSISSFCTAFERREGIPDYLSCVLGFRMVRLII